MALGLGQKLRQEHDNNRSPGDYQEKRPGIDESVGCQESHGADIAEGTGHTGDLPCHAALDQGNNSEDSALACLHEERAAHHRKHCQKNRPFAGNLRQHQVTDSQAGDQDGQ